MPHKTALRIALAVTSTLATLLISEVILEVVDKPKPVTSGWRGLGIPPSEMNQLGFRGQLIEYGSEDFVITLLGNSQAEAAACAYEWMPERRLEYYLNASGRRVRVFTVGAGGYGQDQELLALQEYFEKYRADMVVLWETPSNDVWNNLFPTHYPADGKPKPTFWLEGGRLRGPSELIGQPISDGPRLKSLLLLRRVFHWSRDARWERRYPPPYKPLAGVAAGAKDDWQRWWDDNTHNFRNENLDNEKSHLAVFLTPRSERMQYGLDLTNALLKEIEGLTRSRGGRLVAFTQQAPPSEEDDHVEGVHSLNGKYYATSGAQYRDNVEYMNRGIDFLMLPVTVGQWKVGPDNTHLNEHATDQVMRDLAGQLEAYVPAAK